MSGDLYTIKKKTSKIIKGNPLLIARSSSEENIRQRKFFHMPRKLSIFRDENCPHEISLLQGADYVQSFRYSLQSIISCPISQNVLSKRIFARKKIKFRRKCNSSGSYKQGWFGGYKMNNEINPENFGMKWSRVIHSIVTLLN